MVDRQEPNSKGPQWLGQTNMHGLVSWISSFYFVFEIHHLSLDLVWGGHSNSSSWSQPFQLFIMNNKKKKIEDQRSIFSFRASWSVYNSLFYFKFSKIKYKCDPRVSVSLWTVRNIVDRYKGFYPHCHVIILNLKQFLMQSKDTLLFRLKKIKVHVHNE